ncbi:hypothetical protein ABNN70_07275 [Sporolactobacillus sp. Y61]|uniref:Uncharacterized protein n=1 Tax=Sporolactobacillus sp. Y61 TaxID=3160863 RepID=A0AAU8IJU5_9BACL|nr:hypothetical protein [Sporolactobacillus sp. THM19-2]RYL88521.1 hypothetical protein EWH91_11375 [Sporolactobacillus sp. THM19-2]
MATRNEMLDQDFVIDEAALERMKQVNVLPEDLKSPFVIYESATPEQRKTIEEKMRRVWGQKQ